MSKRLLIALAMLLAGAALGYSFGKARSFRPQSETHGAQAIAALSSGEGEAPLQTSAASTRTHQFKALLSRSTDREALLWLRQRWGELNSSDYAAAATDIIALGAGRHGALLSELMEAWGEIAPLDALAFAETQHGGVRKHACEAVIRGWNRSAPDALLAWYEARKDDFSMRVLKATILSALAESRPDAAFALLSDNGDDNFLSMERSFYFTSLAKVAPNKAVQFFNQLSETEKKAAISPLLTGWMTVDPEAATAWITTQPKGSMRDAGLQQAVSALALFSPREAAELALREITNPDAARNAAFQLAQHWVATDPEEAERFFSAQPDSPLKTEAMRMIDAQWATLHPIEYLDHAIEKGDFSQEASLALLSAVNTLGQQDAAELERWLTENRHAIPPDQLSRMVSSSAYSHPERSAQLLALIPAGSQADSAHRTVASAWARKDIAAARAFLETLPEGSARTEFQAALLGRLAETNLPEALREIESITDSNTQKSLVTRVAQQTKDPESLARWLQSRPQEQGTASLYGQVAQYWFRADPAATAAWIEKLPEGEARQSSIRAYAVEMTGSNPKTALEWAQRLENEKTRETTLSRIVNQWVNADRVAATEWVKESALPEKIKKRYLKE